MAAASERICRHERLMPTDWNQAKPKPCAMVAQAAPWGKIEWYCPICDWGWSSPDEALEAMTHAIEKAAQAVFGKEAADTSTEE